LKLFAGVQKLYQSTPVLGYVIPAKAEIHRFLLWIPDISLQKIPV